jgi:hypothetical protein
MCSGQITKKDGAIADTISNCHKAVIPVLIFNLKQAETSFCANLVKIYAKYNFGLFFFGNRIHLNKIEAKLFVFRQYIYILYV